MKTVFAGPSLYRHARSPTVNVNMRGPARQGDIFRAVEDGVNVIGLIDGVYENVPAVWHKEILFALSQGVQIFGGGSLGALRAVECAAFGMVGVGAIFESFRSGELEDDAEVALEYGPSELDYLPLSEALVNVRATLHHNECSGLLTAGEASSLLKSARSLFFKSRSWRTIIAGADLPAERSSEIETLLGRHRVNQKLADALLVLQTVQAAEDRRTRVPDWEFARTSLFDLLLQSPAR